MPDPTDTRRTHWEDNILAWDEDRYGRELAPADALARAAKLPSGSVRFRLGAALAHLRRHVRGKRVVEIGCGTGRLAPELMEAGAASYLGIDIAANAIAEARIRTDRAGFGDRVMFQQGDVAGLRPLSADLVVSLGLISRLSRAEIDHLFAIGRSADFLHSVAEWRLSPRQWLKRLHNIRVTAGASQVRYRPMRYFARTARRHGHENFHVRRDPGMNTSALISSLPF